MPCRNIRRAAWQSDVAGRLPELSAWHVRRALWPRSCRPRMRSLPPRHLRLRQRHHERCRRLHRLPARVFRESGGRVRPDRSIVSSASGTKLSSQPTSATRVPPAARRRNHRCRRWHPACGLACRISHSACWHLTLHAAWIVASPTRGALPTRLAATPRWERCDRPQWAQERGGGGRDVLDEEQPRRGGS